MATIGGISCTFIHTSPAEPEASKARVQSWTRPGMSGEAAHLLGYSAPRYRYTCVFFDATKASVLAWCRNIEALQGTIVTIVDDFGDSYTNMLIKGVSQPIRRPAYKPTEQYRGEVTVWGTQR